MVGLYSELFYAITLTWFPYFCCSAIPTSHQNLMFFSLVIIIHLALVGFRRDGWSAPYPRVVVIVLRAICE